MKKAQQFVDMSDEQVLEHLTQARRELFGLRLQHATGELENTAGLRAAKRDIARTLTIARQRGLNPDGAPVTTAPVAATEPTTTTEEPASQDAA